MKRRKKIKLRKKETKKGKIAENIAKDNLKVESMPKMQLTLF